MGKGKPRWASAYYKVIEDDTWTPNDDWKNEDPQKIREDFKEMFGIYPEEADAMLPPTKIRKWED